MVSSRGLRRSRPPPQFLPGFGWHLARAHGHTTASKRVEEGGSLGTGDSERHGDVPAIEALARSSTNSTAVLCGGTSPVRCTPGARGARTQIRHMGWTAHARPRKRSSARKYNGHNIAAMPFNRAHEVYSRWSLKMGVALRQALKANGNGEQAGQPLEDGLCHCAPSTATPRGDPSHRKPAAPRAAKCPARPWVIGQGDFRAKR